MNRKYLICETSLRWVLNMRLMRQNPRDHHYIKIVEEDGHSGGSYIWTKQQSIIIEDKGFEHWLDHTKGPGGYYPQCPWDHENGLRDK